MLFKFLARADGVAYKLMTTRDLIREPWTEGSSELLESADQTAVPPGYKRREVSLPGIVGHRFFRLHAAEIQ